MARVKQTEASRQVVEARRRLQELHRHVNEEAQTSQTSEPREATSDAQSRHDETVPMGASIPKKGNMVATIEEEGEVARETVIPTEPSLEPASNPIDDPVFIPVEDIESLKLILAEEEHFSCKISIRSRFEDYCRTIKENLNEQELKRFRETQFGHLLDVPNHYQHSSQLLLYFILRQIKVNKDYEMWIMVQGTPMRFSMEEYAMITGLNFAPVKADEKLEKAKKNTHLKRKYFKESGNVSVADLEKMLKGMEPIENDDRTKIALLLFLNGVLLGLEPKSHIDKNHMGMVNDIFLFDNQDWGLQTYKKTISSLKKNIKAKAEEQQKNKSMVFNGFVHAFQTWIYEMTPVAANKLTNKRDENLLPRMLRWDTKKWNEKDSPTYKDIERIFTQKDIIQSLLVPTEEEKSLAYMSYATVLEDKDDGVIDPLVDKLRSGAMINRHVGCSKNTQLHPTTPSSSSIPPTPANRSTVPPESTESYNLYEALKTYFDERLAGMEVIVGNMKTHFDERLAQMEGKIDNIAMIVSNTQQSNNGGRQTVTVDELNHNHNWTPIDVERANVVNQDPTFTPAHIAAAKVTNQGCVDLPTELAAMEVANQELAAMEVANEGRGTMSTEATNHRISNVLNDLQGNIDDMNDELDPREFYVTPPTLVVNDNVSLLPQSDVFDEARSKVVCRPFRRKKRSVLLQSPYTDPKKRRKYRRNIGLQYDPLREILDSKKASFEEFMSKPYDNNPIQCGLMRRDQIFFKEIMQPGTWLNCEHIDEALFGLRKRQKKYNDIFNQEVAILDDMFITIVKFAYEEKGNKDSYHCNSDLESYWLGNSPKLGKSWKNMKALYMPLHISENHWVAVKADLKIRKFIVFDSLISNCDEHELEAYMIPLCTMLPIILEQSNIFTKLKSKSRDPWPFIRLTNVPQSNNGDCAIYAIKCIEFDSAGASLGALSDDTIPYFRQKMAIDIFFDDWDP